MTANPNQNRLLAALPATDFDRLALQLVHVAMPLGEMLYEPGCPLHRVYFPTTAVVSLHSVLQSGESAESSAVGSEGIVGIALFMGGDTVPSTATVQIGGHGYSLQASFVKQEFDRAGPMQRLLLRYTQALIAQTMQTAVCNRHHSVEQQICRWLLSTADRVLSREIVVTHDMIAGALGVRRESVTSAAGALQRAGVIRYRRGHISVLERSGLESGVCECYVVVKRELTRLFSEVQSREQPSGAAAGQTDAALGRRYGLV